MSTTKNYWLHSGIINLLQNALTVLVGFAGFYLLVRVLPKEEYGTWILYLSVVGILEIARNGLTQNAIIKYLSAAEGLEQGKITTASLVVNATLTVFISFLIIALAPYSGTVWHSELLPQMFYLYCLQFLISSLLNQFNCMEQAKLSFTGTFVSNTVRQVLFLGYLVYCFTYRQHASLFTLVYVQLIAVIIATGIAWYYSRRHLLFSKKLDINWMKKILHYGKYAFGISISSMLSSSIDQMMLGSMLSKAATGSYNIAVRISNLVDIPTNAMAAIVFPQSAKRVEEEGISALKYLYEKSVGTILGLLVPALLFVFLFTEPIITLLVGEQYHDAIPLLHITLVTALFVPYGRQVGTILSAAGRTRLNFFIVLFTALVNILLNFFFIKQMGVVGAAYATLIANAVGFLAAQFILRKDYHINMWNPWAYAWLFYKELYQKFILKSPKSA
ncbi:flippase [Olivibacter ginsenosidimutans]|uniref:Flippase n=1 Tax=Olivibacter ginsenosidimutans TaxID=1176537 RepID=A0ABP9AE87_9SPHI